MAHGAPRLPPGVDHGRAFGGPAGASAGPMSATALPDPSTFTSGGHGTVAGKRGALRRLADRGLDAWLIASGTRHRIGRLAHRMPRRSVLVATLYDPESNSI